MLSYPQKAVIPLILLGCTFPLLSRVFPGFALALYSLGFSCILAGVVILLRAARNRRAPVPFMPLMAVFVFGVIAMVLLVFASNPVLRQTGQ